MNAFTHFSPFQFLPHRFSDLKRPINIIQRKCNCIVTVRYTLYKGMVYIRREVEEKLFLYANLHDHEKREKKIELHIHMTRYKELEGSGKGRSM